jgi:hypothetical protein
MRIYHLIIFSLFTSIATYINAQDIFELTYQFKNDPSKNIYKGLLVKNTDGTGFLRLTGKNGKAVKKVLYDFDLILNDASRDISQAGFTSFPDLEIATNYQFCWSKKYTVKTGIAIPGINYLSFWLKTNLRDNRTQPILTSPFNKANNSRRGSGKQQAGSKYASEQSIAGVIKQKFEQTGVLGFRKVEPGLLTKTYLTDFFTAGELYYDGAYSANQVLLIRNAVKPVLYLITVINSSDPEIGKNCEEDGIKVRGYFKKIADSINIPIVITKLSGGSFNMPSVKKAIANKKIGVNDIVIFYYSGHGFRLKGDQGNPFPEMALYYDPQPSWNHIVAKSYNLENIFNDIQTKKARLSIVLGDCCNTPVNIRRSEVRDTAKAQAGPGYWAMNKGIAAKLFLESKASILIAAAEKGEEAKCSNTFSGFFTDCLINSIRLGLKFDTDLNWKKIIQTTGNKTNALALEIAKENQNIIYRICDGNNKSSCEERLGKQ